MVFSEYEGLVKGEAEARELRRRGVDWDRVNRLPPRLRAAIKYYVEVGDLYVASRIAGVKVGVMRRLLIKLGIPIAP